MSIFVDLPDGNKAEFPDDMSQEQMQNVLQKQFPLKSEGKYSELNVPDTQSISETQFKETPILKETPGFMKNIALIDASLAKGTLEYTGRLASAFEQVLRLGGQPKTVPRAVEYWTDKQKNLLDKYEYSPLVKGIADAGEVGAELLTTAPLSGPFNALTSKATALGAGKAILPILSNLPGKVGEVLGNAALPVGTRKIGEYATAALGGAGLLSGMAGLQSAPNDPKPFSLEQAQEALNNPTSYMLPIGAQMVGNYLNKAQQFGQAQEIFKEAIPRYTRESGPFKTALHLFYDSLPMLTQMGKAVSQLKSIGPVIQDVVKKIARSPVAMTVDDLTNYAAKNLQLGIQKLKAEETLLWEQPGFKSQFIKNPEQVKGVVDEVKNIVETANLPSPKKIIGYLDAELNSGKLTVEKVKNLQTTIYNAASDAYRIPGGTGDTIGKELSVLRDSLFDSIQSSLDAKHLEAFTKAKVHSSGIFQLQDEFKKLETAIKSEVEAVKIVDSLVKDSFKYEKASSGGLISGKGQQAIKARTIAEALDSSSSDAGININAFLKKVDPEYGTSVASKILSPSEFDHVKGLTKYLKSINEGKRAGATGRLVAVGTGIGVGAAEISDNDTWGNMAAVVTYPAMLFAANHPVLKRILGLSTKNLSPSAMKHTTQKIQDILTRGGFFVNDEGVLTKETENK